MKHTATMTLMLTLGVAAVYAQEKPVRMTFSGNGAASPINKTLDACICRIVKGLSDSFLISGCGGSRLIRKQTDHAIRIIRNCGFQLALIDLQLPGVVRLGPIIRHCSNACLV